MNRIRINDKISYIEASDNPLSADIGIIEDNGSTWLYDVGNGEKSICELDGSYHATKQIREPLEVLNRLRDES